MGKSYRTIGIIGDTHIPFVHPGYLDFCKRTFRQNNVTDVVHIGDVVDWHSVSRHDKDPDGLSPGQELQAIRKALKPWYRAFPRLVVTMGNHDDRPAKAAYRAGIPASCIANVDAIYNSPTDWRWLPEYRIEGIRFYHGEGLGGKYAYRTAIERNFCNVVIGHLHSVQGIANLTNPQGSYWGMSVGCGIDRDSYAMAYGKHHAAPCLGVGIVKRGMPFIVPFSG